MKIPNRFMRAAAVAAASALLSVSASAQTAAPSSKTDFDRTRMLAGHLLRRAGFGPSPKDIKAVLKRGLSGWIDWQLNPDKIDDSVSQAALPPPPRERDARDDRPWMRRWYTRMVTSRRQLLEKMTLVWHEHFAVSDAKVYDGRFMNHYEETLRRNALGSFRQMLVDVTRDDAMLVWLDNDPNNGQAFDDAGNQIPPNENYARELLQLFAVGPVQLHMDGTPILDAQGAPLPNYSETDVREIARAVTGWDADWEHAGAARFYPSEHDPNDKTVMGTVIHGRLGDDGAREIEDVADVIMRHPSTAPFIARELVLRIATETPSPGYVERVATVFRTTNGDLKATVRAILVDPEFTSDAVIRTQFKTPIEAFVGAIRALEGTTQGNSFIDWTRDAKHLIYYPPSVFSFFRPGQKRSLVNTALAITRDSAGDELTNGHTDSDGYRDTAFDARRLIRKYKLRTPDQAVDYLAGALLADDLRPEVRQIVVAYMDGRVDETKFRGAAWLIVCSPDFQRN